MVLAILCCVKRKRIVNSLFTVGTRSRQTNEKARPPEAGSRGRQAEAGGAKVSRSAGGGRNKKAASAAVNGGEGSAVSRKLNRGSFNLGAMKRGGGRGERASSLPAPAWNCGARG